MNEPVDYRRIAMLVAVSLFMQNMDISMIAVALPAMAHDLGVMPAQASAVISANVLALAVTLPACGWIGDRLGAKRVFIGAVLIFSLASLACALSQSLSFLLASRVLQGVGAAMMVPVGRLVLLRHVRREQLMSATMWLTIPGLVGPLVGAPLGGLLTDLLSWRSVFWVNLPVGLVCATLAWRLMPTAPVERPPRADLRGMLLAGGACAGLMFGLQALGEHTTSGLSALALLGAGAWMATLLVRHSRRVAHPALDLSLFAVPTFRIAVVAGSVFRVGATALPFVLPLMLQLAFGMSATESGLYVLLSGLGAIGVRFLSSAIVRATSVRTALVACGLVSALVFAALALLALGPLHRPALVVLLLGAGVLRSLGFSVLQAMAFADLAPQKLSCASALFGLSSHMPRALGITLAASSMQWSMAAAGRASAGAFDFAVALGVIALVLAVSAAMFRSLARDAGQGITQ